MQQCNRLISGTSDDGFNEILAYDNVGNIQTLARNPMGTNTYSYTVNQLTGISGFTNGAFQYDVNGNQTYDQSKGLSFSYNYLNLPQTIIKPAISETIQSSDSIKFNK